MAVDPQRIPIWPTAELALDSERGGLLGERLIDFDDTESGPLVLYRLGRAEPGDEADGADGLDEAAQDRRLN